MNQAVQRRSEVMMGACYACKHRGTLIGNVHSKCRHPSIEVPVGDGAAVDALVTMLAKRGRGTPDPDGMINLQIRANQRGIDGNWFLFPWNFDPVWLEHCAGFETEDGLNWEQHCERKEANP